jgi:hypothetical protein
MRENERVKSHWVEIIGIWIMVAISPSVLTLGLPSSKYQPEFVFGVVLAGATALVSLIQLFRAEPQGFVKRLVYVSGGSYLILAVATLILAVAG